MKSRILIIVAIILALIPLFTVRAVTPIQFAANIRFNLGPSPSAVCSGFVDNDNLADLIVAQKAGNSVRVLLGTGAFADYPTAPQPSAVLLGDFDRDGKQDILTGSDSSNTVSLLKGNGDGTFQSFINVMTGTSVSALVSGDFNHDNKPDYAIVSKGSNSILIVLGNGDGTFQAPTPIGFPLNQPGQMLTADFNHDGSLDLLTSNGNNTLSVFLGNGNGTFQSPISHPDGQTPGALAAADFNRDGNLDVVVADQNPYSVSIFLGDGANGLTTGSSYPVFAAPQGIAIADFNGDGAQDLGVAVFGASNNVADVLAGNGDGTFVAAQGFAVDPGSIGVVTLDATAGWFLDGKPDLVVVNQSDQSLDLLRNMPSAILIAPTGTITATGPSFTWQARENGGQYYLWLSGPNGHVLDQWYDSLQICSGNTCSVTPSLTLTNGDYTWWVQQAWLPGAYGLWSPGMNFTVTGQTPNAATLVTPTSSITNTKPTFSWQAATNAQWYYIWVSGPNGHVIDQWYDGYQICSGGTCSVTPNLTLTNGDYIWWVQTWGGGIYGPWSAGMRFSVAGQTPGTAVPTAPIGVISARNPTFTWQAATNAQWYYIWLSDIHGHVLDQWFDGSLICSGGVCSVTPSLNLADGDYLWWVQTWGGGIYGPWSGATAFTVNGVSGPAQQSTPAPTFQP